MSSTDWHVLCEIWCKGENSLHALSPFEVKGRLFTPLFFDSMLFEVFWCLWNLIILSLFNYLFKIKLELACYAHFKICHMVSCFTFCILNNCIFIMIILIYKIYTYLVLDVGKDEDEIEMISLFATTVSLCHLQLADKVICFSSDGINNKQSWKFSSD